MNPYEILLSKFADRRAYILVYDATHAAVLPTLAGIWRGDNPRTDTESIGPLVRQGLAGFTLSSTWKDLAEQLENAGFRRVVDAQYVLRDVADVVRVVFWADGLISCQWLTLGPDDNARSADKPVGIIPSKGRA
jgi:hypothetical protein